jgi:hypothetical protein
MPSLHAPASSNVVLEQYRREHNRRFARQPKDRQPAWRKLPSGVSLEEICAFHTTAKVANDSTAGFASTWTITWPIGL